MHEHLMLLTKKVLRDMHIKKHIGKDGSALHRSCVAQNV